MELGQRRKDEGEEREGRTLRLRAMRSLGGARTATREVKQVAPTISRSAVRSEQASERKVHRDQLTLLSQPLLTIHIVDVALHPHSRQLLLPFYEL